MSTSSQPQGPPPHEGQSEQQAGAGQSVPSAPLLPGPVEATTEIKAYQPPHQPAVQDTPGWAPPSPATRVPSAYPTSRDADHTGELKPAIVGFFSSTKRTGRWEVPPVMTLVEGFADATIDLREAVVTSPVVEMRVYGAFCDIKIIVPPGVGVDLEGGVALFSDAKLKLRDDVDPEAYRLKVSHYGGFASLKVITLAPGEEEPKWWKRLS